MIIRIQKKISGRRINRRLCLKIETKINKEISKASKRFGDSFNKEEFVSNNPRILEYRSKADNILKRMGKSLEKDDLSDIKALIEDLNITCPESGSRNWTDVKQFNLMFGTKLGASADTALDLFLRPETAQGIFVNFLNVQKSGRMKLLLELHKQVKHLEMKLLPANLSFE